MAFEIVLTSTSVSVVRVLMRLTDSPALSAIATPVSTSDTASLMLAAALSTPD
ncbi:MAG: hypothetical protein ACXV7F_14410 [Methylomonas sp.]